MPSWPRDLAEYLLALIPRTGARITGGVFAAVMVVVFAYVINVPPIYVSLLLGAAVFAATFAAWRDGKQRRVANEQSLAAFQVDEGLESRLAHYRQEGASLRNQLDYSHETSATNALIGLRVKIAEWIDRVRSFIQENLGPMAVADFDNHGYHAVGPPAEESFFRVHVKATKHIEGLNKVATNWRAYARIKRRQAL